MTGSQAMSGKAQLSSSPLVPESRAGSHLLHLDGKQEGLERQIWPHIFERFCRRAPGRYLKAGYWQQAALEPRVQTCLMPRS